ncbi:MAG TPA: T9SS type A sorting domain-containing protein [Bacteroidales bacterium]|nr:T9SS type A sorting domain-containing protein [Bacteroidales bacterium]
MISYSADLSKHDTAKVIIFVTPATGVNVTTLSKLNVYPNPSAGQFTLQLPLKSRQKVQAQIINMSGNVMYSSRFEAGVGNNTFSINADLPAGVYLLKVQSDETGLLLKKIFIRK